MGQYLPGKPNAIAQFMPGGGIKMANHLYNVSPRDGTTIGLIYDGAPTNQLLCAEKGMSTIAAARKTRINIEWQGWERADKLIKGTVATDPAVVKATRDLTKG